jgi:hypothetical protein
MFNKTIRSALALLLVFCLMLGVSGNAIAMAISNPIPGAIDKIDNKIESVIADLRDAIADLDAQVNEQEATLNKGKTELTKAEADLAAAEAELEQAKADLLTYGSTPELLAKVDEALAKVDAAQAEVAEAKALVVEAEKTLAQANVTIADATEAVDNVEKTYKDLCAAINNPEISLDYVKNTVKELQDNVNAMWDSIRNLETSVDALIAAYAALENAETDAVEVPEMPAQLTKLDNALNKVVSAGVTLSEALHYYVAAAKPYIAKALDIAEEALGITYNVLKNNLNKEGAAKVYNFLYNNPDKVCAVVKEFGVFGLELMVKYGPFAMNLVNEHSDLVLLGMRLTVGGLYLDVTLGAVALGYVGDHLDFLADYKDDVLNAARKLYVKYGDEAKALVKVYVDYLGLEERYYNATHADVTIFHDSKYIAIGDGSAVGPDSYVDKLAELLEIPHMTENLAELDLTVEEAIELVNQNAGLIGKADLITLGFGNIDASAAMLNALVADYDDHWTTQIGGAAHKGINKVISEIRERMVARGVGQDKIDLLDKTSETIDKAMATLKAKLEAEGLDEATTNMVMYSAEAYMISYVTRAAWYPELVRAVRDANADAQIVIVGTYNDLEGVVIDVAGRKLDIGQLTRGLIAVANLENLVQAFIGDECIYVHASAVETVFEENDYENLNNLGIVDSILNDEMLPSDNGHAYIAEEIYEALNVEYKIWGDVNGDRKVNCRDARLILKYAAGLITESDLDLTWGDVNGDGKVNSRDARLILQMRAEMIEHFPVCDLSEE